jgi:UDP-N-acetylglucosamine/UDP-N-acetylgalactosamine diphosphorylase
MTATSIKLEDRLTDVRSTLQAAEQSHILGFFDELDDAGKDTLLTQIEGIDWPEVQRLAGSHVLNKPEFSMPDNIEPAPFFARQPDREGGSDAQALYTDARKRGEQLIAEGKVAAFTVAGGQGTRLGWDGPKGSFPATPIRKLPLFGCFAEYIIKAQEKWNTTIPWYIMTSPANDADTRAFLEKNSYFSLDPANVMLFPQAMMPAIDMQTGKVLLASKGELALSPNGHGGSLKALFTSGAIADMKKRGVEQISYTQVDNPAVKMVDPLFIGLHDLDDAQMSSKMLPKAFPKEKLGNFCLVDGRVSVIEYSDLPDELAEQRTPEGELRFKAGSIAIHMIRVDFVESLNSGKDGFGLPFHRAEKKVPFVNASGTEVSPGSPNAVKLETFVFDALPLCEDSIIYETDRVEEFAPVKNADAPEGEEPAVDSPASSKLLQIERAARWLEQRGVVVVRGGDEGQGDFEGVIEICNVTAIEPDDLVHSGLPDAIGPETELVV